MSDDLLERARFVVQLFRECDAIQLPHGPTEQVLIGMIDRIEELEAKLAQQDDLVQAAVERGFWLGRSCGGSKAEINAALAAIRAGNNVLCVSCGAPTPNDFCGFCLEEE